MARKVTTVISLRDNYTAVIKKAQRYTSAFQKDVKKMTERLEKASKKKHDIRVKNSAAMKAITAVEKKLAPLRYVMVKVAAHTARFQNAMKPVDKAANKILNKTWTVALRLKDGVTAGLKKITSALQKAAKIVLMGGSAALAGAGYAVNKGMELESYEISMQHFVGVNNPGADKGAVQKQTNDYLGWLRANANATPFGTGEVIQAGSRAVQVAEGNTKAAQGLVRMAEDMAALTPGKTIMDAMEALADAQMGEMERMKEFGFKMTADAFKAAKGNLFATKSTTGMTLDQVFGGGAEKLAKSGKGILSTITGTLDSAVQDAGREMLESLKPFLESLLPVVEKLTPKIKAAGTWAAQVIPKIIAWLREAYAWLYDKVTKAIGWLSEKLKRAKPFIDIIKNAFSNMGKNSSSTLSALGMVFDWVFNAIIDSLNWIAKNWSLIEPTITTIATLVGTFVLLSSAVKVVTTATAIFNAVMAANPITLVCLAIAALIAIIVLLITHWDEVKAAAVAAWEWICQAWVNAAAWFDTTVIQPIITFFTGLWEGIKTAASAAWDGIVSAWTTVSTWFDETVVQPVAGFFGGMWSGISAAAQTAWDAVKGIWETVVTWFQETVITPVTDAVGGIWTGIKNAFDNVSTWFEEHVFGPIRSIVPDWLLNLFGGGKANASVTVVDNRSSTSDGHGGGSGKGFAAGIKRVPYDNFPAILHKGEAVLPSAEAGAYRSQGNQSGKAANNITLNITVNGGNMDENKLASLLVNRLQEAALNMS